MDRQPTKQEIAQRAYAMWEEEGRPHGRNLDHWLAAERELIQASAPPLSADITAKPARRIARTSPKAATAKGKSRIRTEKPAPKDLH